MRDVHITEYSVSGVKGHNKTASEKSSYIDSLYVLKLFLTIPDFFSSEEGQEMMEAIIDEKNNFMRFHVKFLYREGEKTKQCEYGLAVGQEDGKYEIVAENIDIETPFIKITPLSSNETSVARAFYSGETNAPERKQMQKDLFPLKMLADNICQILASGTTAGTI